MECSDTLKVEIDPTTFDEAVYGASRDGRTWLYRYSLRRALTPREDEQAPWGRVLTWIMMNPSTATASTNDPTVNRCRNWGAEWGFDSVFIANVFGVRTPDSTAIKAMLDLGEDPVGAYNDFYIAQLAREANLVVCAWGNPGALLSRSERVLSMLQDEGIKPYALKLNQKTGEPAHPLYLPASSVPRVLVTSPSRSLGREGWSS